MASLLLPRSRPLFSLTLGLGLSTLYATQTLSRPKPLLCEAAGATPLTTVTESFRTYSQSRDAKVPVFKDGRPNPRAYRQISAGSIAGMFWFLSLVYNFGVAGWSGRECELIEKGDFELEGVRLMRW